MKVLIEQYNELRKKYANIYKREIFESFNSGFRLRGIVGNRGVGKTTYLFYYLNKYYKNSDKALYVSADNLYFSNNSLIDLVKKFRKEYDGKLLCIDEIHRYPNWSQELKNIYDQNLDFEIIFSGSSAVDIIEQKYDLSRRAILKTMPGFSFREYLEFKYEMKLPRFTLEEIIDNRIKIDNKITDIAKLQGLFKEYLKIGYYPVFSEFKTEEDVFEAVSGIIDKMINIDLANYFSLKTETLPLFKKILYFVFTSEPGSINTARIAKSLGKSHPDTDRYLEMLRRSGLVRYLLNDRIGHAMIRNAEKVYLNDPSMMYSLGYMIGKETNIGSVREIFVLNQLKMAGYRVFSSKKGDMLISLDKKDIVIEIGGANKTMKQIAGVKNAYLVLDDDIYGSKFTIPLYLFGFLY